MRSLYIPFLYIYKGTVVYKRVYKLGDKIMFKVKIFYKLDTLTYKTITQDFNSEELTSAQINKAIIVIIDELNKTFK